MAQVPRTTDVERTLVMATNDPVPPRNENFLCIGRDYAFLGDKDAGHNWARQNQETEEMVGKGCGGG